MRVGDLMDLSAYDVGVIDGQLASALGITRQAPDAMVAEYLIRQAGGSAIWTQIPDNATSWFVGLAEHLGEYLPTGLDAAPKPLDEIAHAIAVEQITKLRRESAPAVLGVIAPHQLVGGCPAKDLPKVCRVLVSRHLEGFCRRILATWEGDRLIRDIDEL